MILIAGTQRSGTSLLASYFKKLGFDLGTEFWHPSINGGLESPSICQYYADLLNDKTFPFADFATATKDDLRVPPNLWSKFEVQKFSYLLMNPIFVDAYFQVRGNQDKLILTIRNPNHIIKSKYMNEERKKRFSSDHALLNLSSKDIQENVSNSLAKVKTHGFNYELFHFPNFLDDFDKLYEFALKSLGVEYKRGKSEWESIIDHSKINFKDAKT